MIDTITLLWAITHIQQEALELVESKNEIYIDMLAVADSRIQMLESAIVEMESILDKESYQKYLQKGKFEWQKWQEIKRQERASISAEKAIQTDMQKTNQNYSKFDPRKTTTYQYADYKKQLIIDGVLIYQYNRDDTRKFIKVPIDEGNFASNVKFLIMHQEDTFQVKNGYQTYINDYIQWEADRCDERRTDHIFGGYLFTDAMMELSSRCTKERRETIGKIMYEYRNEGLPSHRLKQRLFYENTGVDNDFFTAIARAASFQEEQDLMLAYYHEHEFSTEEEVYKYFNNSEYLKKYPRLKEEIIKDALKWKIGKEDIFRNWNQSLKILKNYKEPY